MNSQLLLFEEDHKINNSKEYYVYILFKRSTGEVIYVGKGKGDRLNQHLKDFYSVIKLDTRKLDSLSKVRDKRLRPNYKKFKSFLEIINNGDSIESKKIYKGLTEEDSFKIEELVIFFLKRKIDYLYTIRVNGKGSRHTLRKFGGKLFNKSVGGDTKGKKVKTECNNLGLLYDTYMSVSQFLEKSEFIKAISTNNHPNNSKIKNYPSIGTYLKTEIEIITQEIREFKIERGIS